MMIMRRSTILLSLMLAACSSDFSTAPPDYVAPSPPTEQSIVGSVKAVAAEVKLTGPLEISAVRPTDMGPGRFFVCLRQADPTIAKRQPYSVFFDNDSYKGSRQSVIREACEAQAYTPIVEPPPPPPAKPDRKR